MVVFNLQDAGYRGVAAALACIVIIILIFGNFLLKKLTGGVSVSESMDKIKIVNLKKSYGQGAAVDNVNLTVRDKEFFSLLGPSGCGKSTTLRCVAGLEEPTAGDIYIGEALVNSSAENLNVPGEKCPSAWCFRTTRFGRT